MGHYNNKDFVVYKDTSITTKNEKFWVFDKKNQRAFWAKGDGAEFEESSFDLNDIKQHKHLKRVDIPDLWIRDNTEPTRICIEGAKIFFRGASFSNVTRNELEELSKGLRSIGY